jgi:malonyl-CoA O-methyltransferase
MLISSYEGHRLWAPHYDTQVSPVLALEARVLSDLLPPIASRCFVDVACGTGRWMAFLRQRGATVFGVDLCPEMLAEARVKQQLRGRSILADAANLPFRTGVADVTLCSFAAGYLAHLHRTVFEMARVTKPGGRVIISDLHPAGVAAGWKRSFQISTSVYELNHFAPSVDELLAAGKTAGLQLYLQIENCFGEIDRPQFRAAGREHILRDLAGIPAVWIGIWKKP